MENDKENVQRSIVATKIPVPMAPLPPIPKHLLKKPNEKKQIVRFPLKTLIYTNTNIGCSSIENNAKSSKPEPTRVYKIDSKSITHRAQNTTLDWNYDMFEDLDVSITSIDEEANGTKEKKTKVNLETKCIPAGTPVVQVIEHKGVRNVKKSLKRPHSRELQGLATVTKEHNKPDGKVRRRLHFRESLHERLQSPDIWSKSYMTCITRDYTEDMFEYLLSVEQRERAVPDFPSLTRACIINWLIKVNGPDGNPATVQTACWYLDTYLNANLVPLHKLQLFATACYWIAQKLHGPVVPVLKLIRLTNNSISLEKLLGAERAVMYTLNFPRQPVTPQEFITYLSWWCDPDLPGEIEVVATFLCISGLMVTKDLCPEYPSAIAANAVKNALLLLGKTEYLVRLKSCPVYQAAQRKARTTIFNASILLQAVHTMSHPLYEYKAPLDHYGVPPYCIAQRIVQAVERILMDMVKKRQLASLYK